MTHVRPEAPSVELARSLATAMDLDLRVVQDAQSRLPTPFHPLRVTRRRPTVTSARCVLPRVFKAPWSRACALDLRNPERSGEDVPLRLLQPTRQWHVHPAGSFEARGGPLRSRGLGATPVGDESPASCSSHEAFDDAPRASVVELHASFTPPLRMGGETTGADPSCGAPIEGPWVCAPEHAALSSARRESSLPLTPLRRR
jgi:hypothetical protein